MTLAAETIAGPRPVTVTRSFPGTPEAVSAVRAWVAGFVPGSAVADDVALITSELVTNAVLHTASGLPGGLGDLLP